MTRTLPHPTRIARLRPRPDATRVGAETAAIAINAVLLLLLLAPMAPRLVEDAPRHELDVVPVHRVRPRIVPPPLPIQPQPPSPSPVVQRAPQPVPPDVAPAVDMVDAVPGDLAADPVDIGPVAIADAVDGIEAAASGASLQTLAAPPPPYPREALHDRLEGTVVLDVHVDAAGQPVDVVIVTSSGHRALDRAAQRQVLRKWRFRPALRDGRAVPALGRVPVSFVLER